MREDVIPTNSPRSFDRGAGRLSVGVCHPAQGALEQCLLHRELLPRQVGLGKELLRLTTERKHAQAQAAPANQRAHSPMVSGCHDLCMCRISAIYGRV
jgi:hypothetical protein